MGGSEKEKKEKKDKGDKKDKKKERAESRKDLKSAAAKTEEANKAAEASAPAPAAAAAIPVAAKDPQPVAEIAAAASAPNAAPAAPSAAVEHKEPVATPASPGRDTDKKPVTRERAKTLDDGIPSNAKKEKEREGKPKYELVDLNKQSIGVREEGAPEGAWARRSALLKPDEPLPRTIHDGIDTLWANFARAVELHGDNKCFGTRTSKPKAAADEKQKEKEPAKDAAPAAAAGDDGLEYGAYTWLTYKQVHAKVLKLSSQLATRFGLKQGDAIGIWSKNCLNWMLADLAASSQSLVTVSIYDTFGPAIVEYVLNHAEVRVVFAADITQLRALLKVIPKCPSIRAVVLFTAISDQVRADFTSAVGDKLTLHFIDDLLNALIDNPAPLRPPKASDLAVLMYTSGTTGMPKAVMQSHGNMIALTAGVQPFLGITSKDVYLSYLPLAHIFEREAMTAILGAGGSVGFYSGHPARLIADIGELRPTVFTGVPRVFDRVYQAVQEKVRNEKSAIKKSLFNKAYDSRKSDIKKPGNDSSIWNLLVFSKTKERLGGRVRLIVSGGAPLSPSTQEFLKICFCCPVLQGYGLTETCAGGTIQNPRDPALASVGPPIPGVEIKLVEVADMGYSPSANPPTGEIWIRGPCVSDGYYKDAKLTATDFSDGWFHTGDVGRWNANGTLSIIDRKKNIFKLAQGEYVAAEKCEMIFTKCQYLSQLFIYGDSFKSVLIGIGVGNKSAIAEWAATKPNLASKTFEQLLVDPELIKMILDDLAAIGKKAGLQGFELPRGLILRATEFTVEEDLITPTFKFKRANIKKVYQKEIDECYSKLDAAPAAEKGLVTKEEPKAAAAAPVAAPVAAPEPKKEAVAAAPAPAKKEEPSPLAVEWSAYLRSVGVSDADVEAYAQALAAHDFTPAEAGQMSAFHLKKKPFLFSEANAAKIASHSHSGSHSNRDKKEKKEANGHHANGSDARKSSSKHGKKQNETAKTSHDA